MTTMLSGRKTEVQLETSILRSDATGTVGRRQFPMIEVMDAGAILDIVQMRIGQPVNFVLAGHEVVAIKRATGTFDFFALGE